MSELAVVATAVGVALIALDAAPKATKGVRITSATKELTGALLLPHEADKQQRTAAVMMVSWVVGFFIRNGPHAPTRFRYSK